MQSNLVIFGYDGAPGVTAEICNLTFYREDWAVGCGRDPRGGLADIGRVVLLAHERQIFRIRRVDVIQ
ncbi:MAG TPA: hypothetical protein VE684_02360 [Crenalkalicoccus sp.]|nr:hypothetical protein [Crenalkalicoccus sp.]